MISQCPNCQSRFAISGEQLSVANGHVRCGTCMKVFVAIDNRVNDDSDNCRTTSTNSATMAPETGTIPLNKTQSIPSADQHNHLPNSDFENRAGRVANNSDKPSEAEIGITGGDENKAERENEVTRDWLNELLPEKRQASSQNNAPPAAQARANQSELPIDAELVSEPAFIPSGEMQRIYEDGRIEPSMHTINTFERLNSIETQPVEIALATQHWRASHWLHSIGGSLLCLGLLAALFAQWMLNHPADFQHHPRWQQAYAIACQLSQCQLAASEADYQAQSLRVYEHPEQNDALIVETVIINTSEQLLPFPHIELRFSDADGNSKAYRRFTSAEYLHGELSGASDMPRATPVHIAIEIKNPGDEAVNYTLKLKPAS